MASIQGLGKLARTTPYSGWMSLMRDVMLNPNPPKGCGHADVVRDEGGMNGWCGFDPYGFDRVWALEAHQWEVDDPGWR